MSLYHALEIPHSRPAKWGHTPFRTWLLGLPLSHRTVLQRFLKLLVLGHVAMVDFEVTPHFEASYNQQSPEGNDMNFDATHRSPLTVDLK